jgi:hypothetical protein
VRWSADRPGTLVVACSDGRLQGAVDSFLEMTLGVAHYDRLYIPGGPAALAPDADEYQRKDVFRRDLAFLLEAHKVEQLVFLFHGPAHGGPEEAICADYRRRFRFRSPEEIARRQAGDAEGLLRESRTLRQVRVLAFRAEVCADQTLRFVDLAPQPVSQSA